MHQKRGSGRLPRSALCVPTCVPTCVRIRWRTPRIQSMLPRLTNWPVLHHIERSRRRIPEGARARDIRMSSYNDALRISWPLQSVIAITLLVPLLGLAWQLKRPAAGALALGWLWTALALFTAAVDAFAGTGDG